MKFPGDEAFLSSSVQDELTYEQPTGGIVHWSEFKTSCHWMREALNDYLKFRM